MYAVVGIGASAGGLDALEKFFTNLPARTDMAFVVVQHLSPDVKSLMGDLLSSHTDMPVVSIEHGISVEPGAVYLIPPRKNVTLAGGKLLLSEHDSSRRFQLPIDFFFQSLADDQGSRAIGIILSGTGSDGTSGIRAIKERDGLVLVQDEGSAQFDGMPRSAIYTGLVDLVLPPEDMGGKLVEYVETSFCPLEQAVEGKSDAGQDSLGLILQTLRRTMDLDLSYYKQPTVRRRIERRMSLNRMHSLAEYALFLRSNRKETESLYHDLLIGVTQFFRDPEAFGFLSGVVIPKILQSRKVGEPIRVWVAACSTGEEAYSVGILFRECIRRANRTDEVRIFATDVGRKAIEFAGAGLYSGNIVADVPAEYLNRYFVRDGSNYQVCKEVREMIVFAVHNLIQDPPFSKMDLICCRNMLIYFQPVLQSKVLSLFDYSLQCNGYLFLGPSESIGEEAHSFLPVEAKWKIYLHKEQGKIANQNMEQHAPSGVTSSASLLPEAFPAAKTEKSARMKEQLHRILVQMHVGPAIIVDEAFNVLLILGGATRFLNLSDGIPSYQLDDLLENKAALAVRAALGRAFQGSARSRFQYVMQRPDGSDESVDASVEAMPEGVGSSKLALIRFAVTTAETASITDIGPVINQEILERIGCLEQELQDNREALQTTIVELEASNEELLTSNEELQSTNVELHSVNQELISLNAEYQAKITELTDLNDDIGNFLGNTRIGMLFLDRSLCIRKFTQTVRTVINLMDQDVGRPLGHLSHHLSNTDLLADCRVVLETTAPVKKEVPCDNGMVWLMDILPYRTRDNQVKGVVVSFVDMTELKTAQSERDQLVQEWQRASAGRAAHAEGEGS